MKGDHDCLEIMKGDHDCFDPMVHKIILRQVATAQNKKNVKKGSPDCLEIMQGSHDCFFGGFQKLHKLGQEVLWTAENQTKHVNSSVWWDRGHQTMVFTCYVVLL